LCCVALALLQLAKGLSAPRNAGIIPLTAQGIRNVGHRYQQFGWDRALYEKQPRWSPENRPYVSLQNRPTERTQNKSIYTLKPGDFANNFV
jgi:hypothetical protein